MRRALGNFESAAAISGEQAVFNIVMVLRLENMPAVDTVREALGFLQGRHPFLNVRLVKEGPDRYFETINNSTIPLEVIERPSDSEWERVVESEINCKFNHPEGPLVRCGIIGANQKFGELILTGQHSIVDGISVVTLLQEMLTICSSLENRDEINDYPPLSPLPPVEEYFPPGFRGLKLNGRILKYFLQQMGDELSYQFQLREKRKAPIDKQTRGRILSMRINQADTENLVRRARRERVTLNSLLNAAALLTIHDHLYNKENMPFRYMSMADLRPYINPPAPINQIASYISPMRFTIHIDSNDDLWSLTKRINDQIYRSTRKGEKFVASVMSKQFLSLTFQLGKFRMCTTAISYSGAPQLENKNGRYEIKGIHGYVSNFGLGPEYSAQVSLYNDELWWDILYLESDMDQDKANLITKDIKELLINGSTATSRIQTV